MILPGRATETVYRRPPDATGAALGFEVSVFSTPLPSARFLWLLACIIPFLYLCRFSHLFVEEHKFLISALQGSARCPNPDEDALSVPR